MTALAILLVLISAAMHAIWNYIAKRATTDGAVFTWMFGAMEFFTLGPLVLLALAQGGGALAPVDVLFIVGSAALHLLYFLLLTAGYRRGELSLVYPLSRGTGPLFVTVGAVLLLGEQPTPQALLATLLIGAGVIALSGDPRSLRRSAILPGFLYGLFTALSIAAYSLWDSYAMSRLLIAPVVYSWAIGWLRAVFLTPYVLTHREEVRRAWVVDRWRALAVALLSPGSYILILTALTFSPVSYVAPLRSVSILIGVLLGAQLLREGNARWRLAGAAAMVVGAALLGAA